MGRLPPFRESLYRLSPLISHGSFHAETCGLRSKYPVPPSALFTQQTHLHSGHRLRPGQLQDRFVSDSIKWVARPSPIAGREPRQVARAVEFGPKPSDLSGRRWWMAGCRTTSSLAGLRRSTLWIEDFVDASKYAAHPAHTACIYGAARTEWIVNNFLYIW